MVSKDVMKMTLNALLDSVDLVSNHCHEYVELYSRYPHKAAQIYGLIAGLKAHKDAIEALRTELDEFPKGRMKHYTPDPEPYGWTVSGINCIYKGAFAAADAKEDAMRAGGTCKAIALYTKDQL